MTERQDYTAKVGPLWADQWISRPPEWPMYSYERPAWIVWNVIANVLHARGWTDEQIKTWLQSKSTRWALDGTLGDVLRNAAEQWAKAEWPQETAQGADELGNVLGRALKALDK